MNRLRQFIWDYQNSFFNPAFYSEFPKRSFWSAFVNIILIGFFVAITVVAVLLFIVFPEARFSNLQKVVVEGYPDELVITIADGQVSTNVEEPYAIPVHKPELFEKDDIENFLVIDTQSTEILEDIGRYKTLMLLTKDAIAHQEGLVTEDGFAASGPIQIATLEDIKSLEISEGKVVEWTQKMRPFYVAAVILAPILITFLITLIISIYLAVLNLFAALVVLIVARMRGMKYSYRDSYVTALFALLPTITFAILADVLGVFNLFSLNALIFIVVVLANVRAVKSDVVAD